MKKRAVRSIRDSLGLTQGQLAALLGVHPLTVSKWERGLLEPSVHQEALLTSFQGATREEGIGKTVGELLVTVGVAAALLALLKAALDK